jgi:hypothetical protein
LAAKHHLWFHHHDWQHLGKLKISWFHFSEQSLWYSSKCAKFSLFKKDLTCSNFETFTSTNTLIVKMLQIKKWKYALPYDEEIKKLNIDDKSSSPFLTR